MKMKNILMASAAIFGMFFVASCDENDPDLNLEGVSLDKQIVIIPEEGGTFELTLKSNYDWSIVDSVANAKGVKELAWPSNLSISPLSGKAGETAVIRFESAGVKKAIKNVNIKIQFSNGSNKYLIYQQAADPAQASPYPEFEAGDYWMCFKQANGNWLASKHAESTIDDAGSYGYVFCVDASGEFPNLSSTKENVFTFEAVDGGFVIKDSEDGYIYQDAAGKYNNFYRTSKKANAMVWTVVQTSDTEYEITSSQGKWIQYSTGYSNWGAYNSKQAEALLPFLVPAKDPAPEVLKLSQTSVSLEKRDSSFVVPATINADQVSVDFEADWLKYYGTNEEGFIFKADANQAGPRTVEVTINASLQGTYTATSKIKVSQAGNAGTLELPMTVEEAIAAANAGLTSSVYIKGIVSELYKGGYDAAYGNGSFYMSADGIQPTEKAEQFEAYQLYWLGNSKWSAENAQIAVGAEVVIYAPLTVYNGLAETQGKGAGYVYSVNGVLTDAEGIGSVENPFTCAGAIAAANAKTAAKVYVSGIVSELYKGGFDPAYGNGSFYMSADGTQPADKKEQFEAYQVNYLENAKWTEENPQIAVGDKVVIYGPLTVYNGLAETQGKGAAYIYSLNPTE